MPTKRREGGAGTATAQLIAHHVGRLRAGADAGKTGAPAEGGGDGAGGKTASGGRKDRLTAPQNAPAQAREIVHVLERIGVPDGIRTRVTAVKGMHGPVTD
jgi:hypothetical protein